MLSFSLSLSLVGNCSHSFLKCFLIDKVVILKWFQVFIKFINKWASSWDIVLDNFLIIHATQVLDNSSKGISMSCNDNSLTVEDLWTDLIVPVGEHSINSKLQRFSLRKDILRKTCISWIMLWVSLIILIEFWGWDIIRSSPYENLLFTMLSSRLSLV